MQQSFLMDLHNANKFINGFVQLQGTNYYEKKIQILSWKITGKLPNIFHDFPGLINKNQRLSRTFQDSKKNPGLFQDVATLYCILIPPKIYAV